MAKSDKRPIGGRSSQKTPASRRPPRQKVPSRSGKRTVVPESRFLNVPRRKDHGLGGPPRYLWKIRIW